MDLERFGRNEAGIGERILVCYLLLFCKVVVKICDYYPTAAVLGLVGRDVVWIG